MRIATLQNIAVSYVATPVLRGVTFGINSGERLGLIGANGAGKTTILRIVLGREQPQEGTLLITAGTRIGYVPQYVEADDDELVIDWMLADYTSRGEELRASEEALANAADDEIETAMEAYQEARDKYDLTNAELWPERATRTLDSLGLQGKENQQVGSLSGGEKNILSLARALMEEPEFLVLDEPTGVVDDPRDRGLVKRP